MFTQWLAAGEINVRPFEGKSMLIHCVNTVGLLSIRKPAKFLIEITKGRLCAVCRELCWAYTMFFFHHFVYEWVSGDVFCSQIVTGYINVYNGSNLKPFITAFDPKPIPVKYISFVGHEQELTSWISLQLPIIIRNFNCCCRCCREFCIVFEPMLMSVVNHLFVVLCRLHRLFNFN